MSLLLKTSKFIKYSYYIRRYISNIPNRTNDISQTFKKNTPSLSTFSTHISVKSIISEEPASKLENLINKLDISVQRNGRISKKEFNELLNEFKKSKDLSYPNSLLMLKCCGDIFAEGNHNYKYSTANKIMQILEEKGFPVDITHYNALLNVYLENNYLFSPDEFLTTLKNKNLEPDALTFQRLMTYYCNQGNLEEAKNILETIKKKNITLNETIFNNLILGHSVLEQYDEAYNLLELMKSHGIKPSLTTYMQILNGYARYGQIVSIIQTIKDLEAKNLFFADKDILELIVTFCEFKHPNEIDNLIKLLKKHMGYNQDAKNTIFKLINLDYNKEAFKILLTMIPIANPNGGYLPLGNFFLHHLATNKKDLKLIIEFCSILEKNGLNLYAYEVVGEQLISNNYKSSEIIEFYKSMNSLGKPIKAHYFWPLFVKSSSLTESCNILKLMKSEFNIKYHLESIKDFLIPNIKPEELSNVIPELEKIGHRTSSGAFIMFNYFIEEGNFNEAIQIVNRYKSNYYNPITLHSLSYILHKNKDIPGFVNILKHIIYNDIGQDSYENIVTNTLLHVFPIFEMKNEWEQYFIDIFKECYKNKIYFTGEMIIKMQLYFDNKMTKNLSEALQLLTTHDIIPKDKSKKFNITNQNFNEAKSSTMYNNNINQQIHQLIDSKNNCNEANLFSKNLSPKQISPSSYALLVNSNVKNKNLEEALNWFEALNNTWPDKSLDRKKFLDLIELLLENNKKDLAISLINNTNNITSTDSSFFLNITNNNSFLANLPNYCNIEESRNIIQTLFKSNFFKPSQIKFDTFIQTYLNKNEVKNAIDQFTWCALNYKITPNRDALLCKLIEITDTNSLQTVVNILTDINGYVTSAYDLVINLLRCNRMGTAKKLLEDTPALRTKLDRFVSTCVLLRRKKDRDTLEKLAVVTKDINFIDPMIIYNELLKHFCNEKETENAINLWKKLKEENMDISYSFLTTFGQYLIQNNINLPFEMPIDKDELNYMTPDKNSKYRNAIINENINEALKERSLLKNLSLLNEMLFFDLLIKNNEYNIMSDIILDYSSFSFPYDNIKKILEKLVNAGLWEVFNVCHAKMNEKVKGKLTLDTLYLKALCISNQIENYLNILENPFVTNDLSSKSIPEITIRFIKDNPEYLSRLTNIGIKQAKENNFKLINLIWIYHFTNRNDLEASKLWADYISKLEVINYNNIVVQAEKDQDVGLLWKLITQFQTLPNINPKRIGYLYSSIIKILAIKEEVDDALTILNNAKTYPGIEYIQNYSLVRLRKLLKEKNIEYDL